MNRRVNLQDYSDIATRQEDVKERMAEIESAYDQLWNDDQEDREYTEQCVANLKDAAEAAHDETEVLLDRIRQLEEKMHWEQVPCHLCEETIHTRAEAHDHVEYGMIHIRCGTLDEVAGLVNRIRKLLDVPDEAITFDDRIHGVLEDYYP